MSLRRFLLLLPLLLVLPACRVRAEELCLIDASIRKADPRLSQRVSLTEPRLPLGALLERLTALTGVSLRMDNTSIASGAMLVVVLRDQPLADTMNSLYAFFGYRNARWEWHRSGDPGKYSYFFAQTQSSRDLTTNWKQQAQDAFNAHAKTMFEIARMTPEERKRSAAKIDHSLLDCPDYIGKSWIEGKEQWQALRAFLDSVKPEDQQKVLMAGGKITVPMASLTDEGRAFATEQASHTTLTVNGEPKSNVPDGITFCTQWIDADTAPIFFAGNMSELAGSALQMGLNARQAAQWLLEGDKKTHLVEAQSIKAPEKPYPDGMSAEELSANGKEGRYRNDLQAMRLLQMTHEIPQNMIAHLPDRQWDVEPPYGKTEENFLAWAKRFNIPFMQKWRGDTLLIEYPAWYLQQAQNIPYAVWKPFAQAVAANKDKDALPLPIVAKTIAALSEAQWKHLLTDAPALEAANTLSGLFGLAVRYPDMLREGGAALTPALADELRHTPPNSYSKAYKVTDAAQALRIHQQPSSTDKEQIEVSFEVQDRKSVWHYVNGYNMPRKVKNF